MGQLFASDVDSTLVFPARTQPSDQPSVTVEQRDNLPLACASPDLPAALGELAAARVDLVPVTARSWRQLRALSPLASIGTAITAAGGRIWRDGRLDPDWDRHVRRATADAASLPTARRQLHQLPDGWVVGEERIEGCFFFLMARHGTLPPTIEAEARAALSPLAWTAYAHGRKLYCLPHALRKEEALAWLVERLDRPLLAAAGDSEMDAALLMLAPHAFCPAESSLARSPLRPTNVRVTRHSAAAAGPEIVRAVVALAHRHERV